MLIPSYLRSDRVMILLVQILALFFLQTRSFESSSDIFEDFKLQIPFHVHLQVTGVEDKGWLNSLER